MAVAEDWQVLGSISGGCVEAATVHLADSVIASGHPVHESFGVTDDDAFAVGLTCGGTIEVFVEPASAALVDCLRRTRKARREQRAIAVGVIIDGTGLGCRFTLDRGLLTGSTGSAELDRDIATAMTETLVARRHALVRSDTAVSGPVTLFVQVHVPPPRMIIFGAVDFARALSRVGKLLGFHVTVCDARPVFATSLRFPEADEVVADWPSRFLSSVSPSLDGHAVVCVLTHDPKFDVPLLEQALKLPVAYVGAMGSRRVSATRAEQLRLLGVTEAQLERLHAPIGLDIGGSDPMETAISIAAEIIATRESRSGRSLKYSLGPIHSDAAEWHESSDPPDEQLPASTARLIAAVHGSGSPVCLRPSY